MAFWICDQAIRLGAFTYTFGEDGDESSENLDDMLEEENREDEEAMQSERQNDQPDDGNGATGNLIEEEERGRPQHSALDYGGAPTAKDLGRYF